MYSMRVFISTFFSMVALLHSIEANAVITFPDKNVKVHDVTEHSSPILVWDVKKYDQRLPIHFRSTLDSYKKEHLLGNSLPSRTGLGSLNASASGQFSEVMLYNILHDIKKQGIPTSNIYIVDLRLEPHIFLNGQAISLYGFRNSFNKGEHSPDDTLASEKTFLTVLSSQNSITVHKIVGKDWGEINKTLYTEFDINHLESEETLIKRNGAQYARFYVLDRHRPDDKTVDHFLKFYHSLPSTSWVHYHCRGGSGRSTTFMVMHDILHNAGNVSFKEIIERQYLIGKKNLAKFASKDSWKHDASVERYQFLKEFYAYVTSPNGYKNNVSWSTWQKKKS